MTMKQIFEWLREQCKDRSESCYKSYLKLKSDEDYGCSFAYAHAVDLINEAEAKWEAEVCEWKRGKTKVMILSPHNPQSAMWTEDVKMYPYCNCCGKRIKISEVE